MLSPVQAILPALEAVVQAGKPLLIIAEDVEGEVLATLVGINIVRKALQTPARQIFTNAGEDGSVIVGKIESCRFSIRESSLSSVLSPASRSTTLQQRSPLRRPAMVSPRRYATWLAGQARGTLSAGPRTFWPPSTPVHIVYPHSRLFAAKVRAFVDWSAPRLSTEIFRLSAAQHAP